MYQKMFKDISFVQNYNLMDKYHQHLWISMSELYKISNEISYILLNSFFQNACCGSVTASGNSDSENDWRFLRLSSRTDITRIYVLRKKT